MLDRVQAQVDEVDALIRDLEERLQAIAVTHPEYASTIEDLRVAKQHWQAAKDELAKF
jgi:prefoldin subunit 5